MTTIILMIGIREFPVGGYTQIVEKLLEGLAFCWKQTISSLSKKIRILQSVHCLPDDR